MHAERNSQVVALDTPPLGCQLYGCLPAVCYSGELHLTHGDGDDFDWSQAWNAGAKWADGVARWWSYGAKEEERGEGYSAHPARVRCGAQVKFPTRIGIPHHRLADGRPRELRRASGRCAAQRKLDNKNAREEQPNLPGHQAPC